MPTVGVAGGGGLAPTSSTTATAAWAGTAGGGGGGGGGGSGGSGSASAGAGGGRSGRGRAGRRRAATSWSAPCPASARSGWPASTYLDPDPDLDPARGVRVLARARASRGGGPARPPRHPRASPRRAGRPSPQCPGSGRSLRP